MRRLTAKQERFAQLVFAGARLVAAYRTAYSSYGKESTARVEASRLAGKSKIVARIDELRAFASIGAVCAHLDRREYLAEIIRFGTCRDMIRSIRQDAILSGDRPRRVRW